VGVEPTTSAMPTKNVDHCQMIMSGFQVKSHLQNFGYRCA
jgi:hypothetical protein